MKVVIHSEEDLVQLSRELLHTLVNLNYWSKECDRDPYTKTREAKRRWQKRADELLLKYGITKTDTIQSIKIKIDAKQDTTQKDQRMEDA